MWNISVRGIRARRVTRLRGYLDLIEAIHRAAVVFGRESRVAMVEIIRSSKRDGLESNRAAGGILSTRHRVSAWESVKEIVDGAVFLKDDDDVLNPAWPNTWI